MLAEPEFQHPKSWFETWLVPWLAGIIDRIAELGPILRYALIGALVIVTLIVATWVVRSLLRVSRRGDAAPVVRSSSETAPDERTAEELRHAAAKAARSGAFAESIRLSWMAVIALLESSQGVASGRPHVARADFEYVADAQRAGAPAKAIADLAVEFQRVRFGGIVPSEVAAVRCLELAAEVDVWGSDSRPAGGSHG